MTQLGLSKQWRRWAASALAQGCSPREVAEALIAEGASEALAARELAILADALGPLVVSHRRMELILRMLATVAPRELARRPLCDADTFFAECFTRYQPVVFEGGCAELGAARWSFAGLRARLGHVELDIGYPDPQTMTLAAAIDAWLGDAPPELYLMSHNRALAGPLAPLRADLDPLPDFLAGARAVETANLWMGPAASDSPLHHDTTHVYFCQLVGRKRYQLVAPWEPAALAAPIVRSWDSSLDVDAPGPAQVLEVVLEPGDALFIPTGWWHRVLALTPSISVSMRDFLWPTDHAWYAPGRVSC